MREGTMMATQGEAWYTRGIEILGARFGLASNNRELIYTPEFFEDQIVQSQRTNFYRLNEVPYGENLDALVTVIDSEDLPLELTLDERSLILRGDISKLDKESVDRRNTLFGNKGLFFRFCLRVLERDHKIFGFHSAALFDADRRRLIILAGPPGVGKTAMLLAALRKGFQILSTEMLYYQFRESGCAFFKGALLDNVRTGSLTIDFPDVAKQLGIELPNVEDVWGSKITLDLTVAAPDVDEILNPDVLLLFPRIEGQRTDVVISEIKNTRKIRNQLYENASEKMAASYLLYDVLPICGLETPDLMRSRFDVVTRFLSGEDFHFLGAKTILAGPQNCLDDI
ncbi:MAG: hypothetical protein A2Z14_19105 [Chloroflexi bacterium RBG_16_48_8]|nr:MAG: hypothetical protein A2Z14_19105 [Chloroflexi bacterium RBG_16_48_8]